MARPRVIWYVGDAPLAQGAVEAGRENTEAEEEKRSADVGDVGDIPIGQVAVEAEEEDVLPM